MSKKQITHYPWKIFRQWFLLFILSHNIVISYAQELNMDLKQRSVAKPPDNTIRRMLIQAGDSSRFGYVIANEGIVSVERPGKVRVQLPLKLPLMVSADGNTIIQYGDQVMLDEPVKKDIFWINDQGEIKKSVIDKYKGDAWIDVSSDGYTAIGGGLLEGGQNEAFSFYSPVGDLIFEGVIPQGRRISQIYPAGLGKGVVLISTNSEEWLEEFRLGIYNSSGRLVAEIGDLGIIQRLVLLNDSRFFFQGLDNYGVIDMSTGRILWKNPGKVTLASPNGAVLSPDGNTLYLAVIKIEGRKTGIYTWLLKAFDSHSGKEKLSYALPDKYPTNWEDIFRSVTDSGVVLSMEDKDITITLKGGGR